MKNKITDPYSLELSGGQFADYYNEIFPIVTLIKLNYTKKDILESLKNTPIREVQVRYAKDLQLINVIKSHPLKVKNINDMVKMANTCKSIEKLKSIFNEINKLIFGKNKKLIFKAKKLIFN